MTEFVCLIWNDMEDTDDYGRPLEDIPTSFGVGVELRINDRIARIAVKLKRSATFEDFRRAWKKLALAARDPYAPESKTAWDEAVLTGNEIEI
jgi:hypothetical protein